MIVKIHKTPEQRIILAVCDIDLLGKKFEEGNRQIDLSSEFYNGEKMPENKICDLMRNSYILNLVGKKSVGLALKECIITKDNIKKIKDIPYSCITLDN
jgi:hypothetical protein